LRLVSRSWRTYRERFRNGQYTINIEAKTFSMAEYNELLASELWQESGGAGMQ